MYVCCWVLFSFFLALGKKVLVGPSRPRYQPIFFFFFFTIFFFTLHFPRWMIVLSRDKCLLLPVIVLGSPFSSSLTPSSSTAYFHSDYVWNHHVFGIPSWVKFSFFYSSTLNGSCKYWDPWLDSNILLILNLHSIYNLQRLVVRRESVLVQLYTNPGGLSGERTWCKLRPH